MNVAEIKPGMALVAAANDVRDEVEGVVMKPGILTNKAGRTFVNLREQRSGGVYLVATDSVRLPGGPKPRRKRDPEQNEDAIVDATQAAAAQPRPPARASMTSDATRDAVRRYRAGARDDETLELVRAYRAQLRERRAA